jgi:hypothetical protein
MEYTRISPLLALNDGCGCPSWSRCRDSSVASAVRFASGSPSDRHRRQPALQCRSQTRCSSVPQNSANRVYFEHLQSTKAARHGNILGKAPARRSSRSHQVVGSSTVVLYLSHVWDSLSLICRVIAVIAEGCFKPPVAFLKSLSRADPNAAPAYQGTPWIVSWGSGSMRDTDTTRGISTSASRPAVSYRLHLSPQMGSDDARRMSRPCAACVPDIG